MTATNWLGLVALVLMFAFVAFAFRQGTRVPPSGRDPTDHVQPPS
jgi:hypothetical protein